MANVLCSYSAGLPCSGWNWNVEQVRRLTPASGSSAMSVHAVRRRQCCECQVHRCGVKQWMAGTERGITSQLFFVVVAAGFPCSGSDWNVAGGGKADACVDSCGISLRSLSWVPSCECRSHQCGVKQWRAGTGRDGRWRTFMGWCGLCSVSGAIAMHGECFLKLSLPGYRARGGTGMWSKSGG